VENLEIKQNNCFDFHSTPLEGLWVVQRKPIKDQRGFFCRFFCAEEFQVAGLKKPVAQINHTHTVKKGGRPRSAFPISAVCRRQDRQLPSR
jgi:dTDP-4-dehydrorhamnose 3,5-epimerase-like enzyme